MRARSELIEALASEALRHAGVEQGPPIDIHRIVGAHGVALRSESLNGEAGRLTTGSNPTVYVDCEEPAARQRFTVAHELGHWLLLNGEGPAEYLNALIAEGASEEYICNQFAGALLMPRSSFVARFRGQRHTLQSLLRISSAYDVSLSAAIVRARDLLHWRRSLLRWVHDGGNWALHSEAGLLPSQGSCVGTTDATRFELSRLRAAYSDRPTVLSTPSLPLMFDGTDIDPRADVMFGRQNGATKQMAATAMVCLPVRKRRGSAGAQRRS